MNIKPQIRKDQLLSRVLSQVTDGQKDFQGEDLSPLNKRKEVLSVEYECLMWGIRVIIPEKLQQSVLDEIHVAHLGVVKMKVLARSCEWWPRLDSSIEEVAA